MANLLNEYEFKGQRLQPFSKGRLSLCVAAGVRVTNNPPATIKDILGIIFICLCDYKIRALAQTDPAMFWEEEGKWEEENVLPEDFGPAAELAKRLLDDATSTKAEPMDNGDLSQLPDPLPNSPSQTI